MAEELPSCLFGLCLVIVLRLYNIVACGKDCLGCKLLDTEFNCSFSRWSLKKLQYHKAKFCPVYRPRRLGGDERKWLKLEGKRGFV